MSAISFPDLSPDRWPFDYKLLPKPIYLVGGTVRDALLGRKGDFLDLDFVVPQGAIALARSIADQYKAGFVVLDAERKIARVVFPEATIDFAEMVGDDLLDDLQRRDYTMNAIAYNPFTAELIDPLGGQQDLQAKMIKMVSLHNLAEDPLRLLRAYRQACQLNLWISTDTLVGINSLSNLLQQVAPERIRNELNYLLCHKQGMHWLMSAWDDNLITHWFPQAGKRWKISLDMELAADKLCRVWPALTDELSIPVSQSLKLPMRAIANLAMLTESEPAVAEKQLLSLKYSNAEIKSVLAILNGLLDIPKFVNRQMKVRDQYFFFQKVGKMFPALAVVAVAHGIEINHIALLVDRYLNPDDQVAHPISLITGDELMTALNLPRGPQIGKLLLEIQLSAVEGKIGTKTAALDLAKQLIA
jgi:tRNA nucleotidyltransferase (CCA-adding enzyme)